MVKLNRIYTRTGDDGTTGLVTGERRKKHDLRVEAYGAVDEANACIGIARTHSVGLPDIDAALQRIQHDLFDLGADLATPDQAPPESSRKERVALRITPAHITRLEEELDNWNENLEPLRSFILPGGTALAASLHMARTVVRRAERLAVALKEQENISAYCLEYLNRLSDHLFVLARFSNDHGKKDILWEQGKNIL